MPMPTEGVIFGLYTDLGKSLSDMFRFSKVAGQLESTMQNTANNTEKLNKRNGELIQTSKNVKKATSDTDKSIRMLSGRYSFFNKIAIGAGSAIKNSFNTIKGSTSEASDEIVKANDMMQQSNKGLLGDIGKLFKLRNKLTDAEKNAADSADVLAGKYTKFGKAVGAVSSKIKGAFTSVQGAITSTFDFIKDSAEDLLGVVKNIATKIPIIGVLASPLLLAAGYIESLSKSMREASTESEQFGNSYTLAMKSISFANKNRIPIEASQQILQYAAGWGRLNGSINDFVSASAKGVLALGLTGDQAAELVGDFGQLAGFAPKAMGDLIGDMKALADESVLTNAQIVDTTKSLRELFINMPYLSAEARRKMTRDFMSISATMADSWQDPQDLLQKYQGFAKDIYGEENQRLAAAFSTVGVSAQAARKDMNVFYGGLRKFADFIEREYGSEYFLQRSSDIGRMWGISGEELVKYTSTAIKEQQRLKDEQRRAMTPMMTLTERWGLMIGRLREPFAKLGLAALGPIDKLMSALMVAVNKMLPSLFGGVQKIIENAPKLIEKLPVFMDKFVAGIKKAYSFMLKTWPMISKIMEIGVRLTSKLIDKFESFTGNQDNMNRLRSALSKIFDVTKGIIKYIVGFIEKHPKLATLAIGGFVVNKLTGGLLGNVANGVAQIAGTVITRQSGAILSKALPAIGKGLLPAVKSLLPALPGLATGEIATQIGTRKFAKTEEERQRMEVGGRTGTLVGTTLGAIFGGPIGAAIGGAVGSAVGQAIGKFLPEIKSFFTQVIPSIFEKSLNYVKGTMNSIWDFTKKKWEEITAFIKPVFEFAERIFYTFIDLFTKVAQLFIGALTKLPFIGKKLENTPVIEALNKGIDFIKEKSFLQFEKGGTIPGTPKQSGLVLTHGSEEVINPIASEKYRPLLKTINAGKDISGMIRQPETKVINDIAPVLINQTQPEILRTTKQMIVEPNMSLGNIPKLQVNPSMELAQQKPLTVNPNIGLGNIEKQTINPQINLGNIQDLTANPVIKPNIVIEDQILKPNVEIQPTISIVGKTKFQLQPDISMGEIPKFNLNPNIGITPNIILNDIPAMNVMPNLNIDPNIALGNIPSLKVEPTIELTDMPKFSIKPDIQLGTIPEFQIVPKLKIGEISDVVPIQQKALPQDFTTNKIEQNKITNIVNENREALNTMAPKVNVSVESPKVSTHIEMTSVEALLKEILITLKQTNNKDTKINKVDDYISGFGA